MCFTEDQTAPSPPDTSEAPSNSPPVNSSGGCARTREGGGAPSPFAGVGDVAPAREGCLASMRE
jgi:hypothetical protein